MIMFSVVCGRSQVGHSVAHSIHTISAETHVVRVEWVNPWAWAWAWVKDLQNPRVSPTSTKLQATNYTHSRI